MRPSWNLGNEEFAPIVGLSTEHVLVDYDGPQVVTARDPAGYLYIGVALDDSDDGLVVRWAYAEISDLEFYALTSGGITVRDSLLKERVFVVDEAIDGGKAVAAWRVADSALPADVLPSDDSFLPPSTRERFAEARLSTPEIRIAGRRVKDNSIPFADLGAITSLLQRLWDSICVAVFYQRRPKARDDAALPSTLMAAATAPGSFGIRVKPVDNSIFDRIAQEYKRLLAVSPSRDSVSAAIQGYPPDVVAAYSDYLGLLESRQLEVLAQSARTSSFVGPLKASRVRSYLPHKGKSKGKGKGAPEDTSTSTFMASGYFEGYSYVSRRFDFVDVERKELYSGDVEDGVLTGTPIDRGLILSSQNIYRADLRRIQSGEKVSFTLLGFWSLSKSPQ